MHGFIKEKIINFTRKLIIRLLSADIKESMIEMCSIIVFQYAHTVTIILSISLIMQYLLRSFGYVRNL